MGVVRMGRELIPCERWNWEGAIPWERCDQQGLFHWEKWAGVVLVLGGKVGWGSPFPAPDPISTLSQASELAERGEPGAIPDRQRILPERPCGTPGNVGGLWPHRPE